MLVHINYKHKHQLNRPLHLYSGRPALNTHIQSLDRNCRFVWCLYLLPRAAKPNHLNIRSHQSHSCLIQSIDENHPNSKQRHHFATLKSDLVSYQRCIEQWNNENYSVYGSDKRGYMLESNHYTWCDAGSNGGGQ